MLAKQRTEAGVALEAALRAKEGEFADAMKEKEQDHAAAMEAKDKAYAEAMPAMPSPPCVAKKRRRSRATSAP